MEEELKVFDQGEITKKLLELYKGKDLSQFLTEHPVTPDEAFYNIKQHKPRSKDFMK